MQPIRGIKPAAFFVSVQSQNGDRKLVLSEEVKNQLVSISSAMEYLRDSNYNNRIWQTVGNVDSEMRSIFLLIKNYSYIPLPLKPIELKKILKQMDSMLQEVEIVLNQEKRRNNYHRACVISFLCLVVFGAYAVLHRFDNLFSLSNRIFIPLTLFFGILAYFERGQKFDYIGESAFERLNYLRYSQWTPTIHQVEGHPNQPIGLHYQRIEPENTTNTTTTESHSSNVSSAYSRPSRAMSPFRGPTRSLPTPTAPQN